MVELQGIVPELKAGQTEIDGERAIPKWPETTADVKIPSVRSSSRKPASWEKGPDKVDMGWQLPQSCCAAPHPQLQHRVEALIPACRLPLNGIPELHLPTCRCGP